MKIPLFKPVVTEDMKKAVINTLESDFFVLGESVKQFENSFSSYIGTNYALSVSSGTDALHLCLEAMGVREKEIITTPASFIATANSIILAGGKPVFVDIDYKTNTLDYEKIEDAITDKTAGIIPIHLYGFPCEMDKIKTIAKKNGIFVLEDACQAHGSEYKNKKVGNLGTAGCFSFYSTKNMTVAGDGGMITTNNTKIAEMVTKIRNCGRKEQYIHDVIGYTSRLNSINAAFGSEQLKLLDTWNVMKERISSIYRESLEGIGDIILPPESMERYVSYHLFVIKSEHRDKLKLHLNKNGIDSGIYYPIPIHLQPIYSNLGFKKGNFPQTEMLSKKNLAIPIFPEMTHKEVEYVVRNIKQFFKKGI